MCRLVNATLHDIQVIQYCVCAFVAMLKSQLSARLRDLRGLKSSKADSTASVPDMACAAVEGSKRMAEAAQSIIEENQLSSSQGGPITVVSGRVEELEALPMQQVHPP